MLDVAAAAICLIRHTYFFIKTIFDNKVGLPISVIQRYYSLVDIRQNGGRNSWK